MKNQYRTKFLLDRYGRSSVSKEVVASYPCCDDAEEHYGSDLMFPWEGEEASFAIAQQRGEFDETTSWIDIAFCPWCGKKMECEEVERVQMIDKVIPVQKWIESNVTDRTTELLWKKEEGK